MRQNQISGREHVDSELFDYFFGKSPLGFEPDEKYSLVDFDSPKNLLGHIPHANNLLVQLGNEIDAEFADPAKRVHGRHYTQNGRMYRWDAREQELIRVLTQSEIDFARELFSSPVSTKVSSRNHHTCRFKREYSQDSTWSLCVYGGKCSHKENLTSVHHGMYGRDDFCGPTTN
ncbi:Uncharacterised protein [uncultured archaeon]|nr:Uncharacterised protein [uncultured archaeon]